MNPEEKRNKIEEIKKQWQEELFPLFEKWEKEPVGILDRHLKEEAEINRKYQEMIRKIANEWQNPKSCCTLFHNVLQCPYGGVNMTPKGYYWVGCPKCGFPKMQILRSDTALWNFPGYCKKCKTESIITIEPKRQTVNS